MKESRSIGQKSQRDNERKAQNARPNRDNRSVTILKKADRDDDNNNNQTNLSKPVDTRLNSSTAASKR